MHPQLAQTQRWLVDLVLYFLRFHSLPSLRLEQVFYFFSELLPARVGIRDSRWQQFRQAEPNHAVFAARALRRGVLAHQVSRPFAAK